MLARQTRAGADEEEERKERNTVQRREIRHRERARRLDRRDEVAD